MDGASGSSTADGDDPGKTMIDQGRWLGLIRCATIKTARRAPSRPSNLNCYKSIRYMVEPGESEYLALLKTSTLLIFRDGQNAENGKIAANWNVSGTRDFSFPKQNTNYRVEL
jgi:hypothetical protein